VAKYFEGRAEGHVIRYEDVTGEPESALVALCDALGTPATEEAEALVATLRPAASIGRHAAHDLRPLLDRGGDEVATALARFGYGE